MIDFFPTEHIASSSKRKFGICDRPAPAVEKSYIAEKQGRSTITHFERQDEARDFHTKKACIANSEKPFFRSGQAERMERFYIDTNYILKIESRIKIE